VLVVLLVDKIAFVRHHTGPPQQQELAERGPLVYCCNAA
jgi:hypothetical protein